MIKLIVTDVDGTIVGKDEILNQEYVDFIKALRKQGILYTIATGRVDGLVQDYVAALELDLPYAACNGGTILESGRVLLRKTISLASLREVIETADAMGMSIMYSIDGQEHAYRDTAYIRQQQELYGRYHQPGGFSEEQWKHQQVDKVIVMAAVRDGSIGVIEQMLRAQPGEIGYKRYADKAIDILHTEAVKEAGVRTLAGLLEVPMKEVLFVGDDLNDIRCLQEAGIGVAVANAQPAAKAAADYIAVQACWQGVMEAVEKFVIRGETL